jgi:hypothetical protein
MISKIHREFPNLLIYGSEDINPKTSRGTPDILRSIGLLGIWLRVFSGFWPLALMGTGRGELVRSRQFVGTGSITVNRILPVGWRSRARQGLWTSP